LTTVHQSGDADTLIERLRKRLAKRPPHIDPGVRPGERAITWRVRFWWYESERTWPWNVWQSIA